jgi:hypothetical protein
MSFSLDCYYHYLFSHNKQQGDSDGTAFYVTLIIPINRQLTHIHLSAKSNLRVLLVQQESLFLFQNLKLCYPGSNYEINTV